MSKTIIIGNWKMNKTFTQTKEFFSAFNQLYIENKNKINQNLDFAVALPAINVAAFSKNTTKLELAVQNMSQFEKGAYTGEISAQMLLDLNVKYAIIGHSERRQYFKETDLDVNAKTQQAIKNNIIPVVCVGETLEEYEAQKTSQVIEYQLKNSLKDVDLSKVIVAYEPIWAIGTGKTATPEQAQQVCKFIRKQTNKNLTILYGGSVSQENIEQLLNQADINGALVGGASLKVDSFIKLLTLNK
ncbi:triose-phosphate isomerase [Mesomycoplasma hyorhinis]|uniref:Triosephosphate isomerase n=4 Tax=Mesomycoplasma hyorhinis TaxID=2100 RepID=TPIS_MESHY|nr:triose-phosphate isomerase [Mesomycoplasma hyorhinis]P50919.1 RecName: Full=Triosephosphate isomerase; Short=TIM; Short=TPI; AltName: Full=Triose-phosphate isomerase [Mesomycoplasma hyorhinis]ADM21628.1 Triosephosphate isomerase [Mesomycoplasma hyorhinis HUB-1]AEC45811.1 Triosephosphate isomerase [Mesomycoplasma hyorhinis MCLD]AEX13962.1 triose-phosphate isomerase [Mesomycoplasma hyorhinis GDL-1]AFX74109.1 Triosephosphate isomerase [Mesomycoplasma hyorhinis SK76]AHA40928.1 triose-phosphate